MYSKIKNILTVINTLVLIAVVSFLAYHGSSINKVTQSIAQQEQQKKDMNTPKKVGISNDALAANSAILGKKDAPITIIKFNSFSCGWCKKAKEVVHKITKTFPNDVRIVYKHYSRGGSDSLTGQAAECAGEQGKFWQAYDKLFSTHSKAEVTKVATSIRLNMRKFNACLSSKKFEKKVQQDSEFGRRLGIRGTPAFIVNGMLYKGYRPFEFFKAEIQKHLK